MIRSEITVVELWPIPRECIVCGCETFDGLGLAMYEDELVDIDATTEWAGFAACIRCFTVNRGRVGRPFVPKNQCDECRLFYGYHDGRCSRRDLTHLAEGPP